MPRDNSLNDRGFIIIPTRNFNISFKVIVTNDETGAETNITKYVLNTNIDWQVGQIASCTISLDNNLGQYLTAFNGGEFVDVYLDYSTEDPTYKLFSGRIDNTYFKLTSNGYVADIMCRQKPELADIKIVEQFDNKLITDAIREIVDTYYNGVVTYESLPSSTARFTGNFRHVSGIKAFKDIADSAEMDLYIDTAGSIQLFDRESVTNTVEVVTYNTNLLSLNKYGVDTLKEYNRVTLYGKADKNIILLKTESDVDSQDNLWRKDLVVTDNSIETMEDIRLKTDLELAKNINREAEGSLNSIGLRTIKPGQNMTVNVPLCGCTGSKNIASVKHTVGPNGFTSSLNIKDIQQSIEDIFLDRINTEERLTPYGNLNNMTDSYTIKFDESPSPLTLTNCTISDDFFLGLNDGETSGTATADTLETDSNVIQAELRTIVNFPNHELCTYIVTNNGGATWEDITVGGLHTFTSSGNQLAFRINLEGDVTHNPVFEAVTLLYKRSE